MAISPAGLLVLSEPIARILVVGTEKAANGGKTGTSNFDGMLGSDTGHLERSEADVVQGAAGAQDGAGPRADPFGVHAFARARLGAHARTNVLFVPHSRQLAAALGKSWLPGMTTSST